MQGTVIGDAVNVAARIEALTRQYGAGILISEAAKVLLSDDCAWTYRCIDRVPIRGRRGATVVWEVLAPEVVPAHAATIGQLEVYHRGLLALQHEHWAEAQQIFRQVLAVTPEDQASQSCLERASRGLEQSLHFGEPAAEGP
jgi:two-component system sensor histidine kinase ChiS